MFLSGSATCPKLTIMWKLTEIYAQNICAFRELQYKIEQGVTTLIFGDNRDNESQRSNGSGKSALLECIALGITGSPLRKIKNEEIINDSSDESLVELTFSNDGSSESFQVERKLFRKGSAEVACYIFRDGEFKADEAIQPSVDAYNKYILEKLGITKDELYNNFLLSSHKYRDFLSSSDKEKKEIINCFSNGNIVDKAIEEIVNDLTPITELQKKTDLEFAGLEGRIHILTEQIQAEEENLKEKAESKTEKISELENKIAARRSDVRGKAEELSMLQTGFISIKETDKKIEDMENTHFILEDYLSEINKHLSVISQELKTDWNAVIKTKKENIHIAESELKTWDSAFDEAERNVKTITDAYTKLNAEFQEMDQDCHDKIESFEKEMIKLEQEFQELQARAEHLKKTRTALSVSIESLNNKLAGTISCPSCSFEFLLSDKFFDVEKAKTELEQKNQSYVILSSKINGQKQKLDEADKNRTLISEEKRRLLSEKVSWTQKLLTSEQELTLARGDLNRIKNYQEQIVIKINTLNKETDGILRNIFDEAFDIIDEAYRSNQRKQNSIQEEIKSTESSIDTLLKTIEDIKSNAERNLVSGLKRALDESRQKSSDILYKKNRIDNEIQTLQRQQQNFIEFKTYLANTKIDALGKITNEFLENIGSDIRIRFSGYTTLKSGKIREKISVSLVRSGIDCGSFGKFSAGEAARVNLATILAMQKLINNNCDSDKGLDLLVLDEILEAVDEEGLSHMFSALNNLNITALIVSHGNIAESYPHTIKIVKENGESRIEY